MNIQFVKIDSNVTDRASKWVLACPSCQFEREVSYCQIWNIKKNKSTGDCRECASEKKDSSTRFVKGITPWNKGKQHRPNRSYEKNKKYMEIVATFGNGYTEETRKKMSDAKLDKTQSLSNAWQGGKTVNSQRERMTKKYKDLRNKILKRDNNMCTICSSNKNLELDHIKEWCNYPELRYVETNCRILCKDCHKTTSNYQNKAKKVG